MRLLLVDLALALAGRQLGLRLRQLLSGREASSPARGAAGQVLGLAHDECHLVGDGLQRGHRQFVRYILQILLALKTNKIEIRFMRSTRGSETHPVGADSNQLVPDGEAAVHLSRSAVHQLGHVDAVVAGDVLVANAAGYGEAQALAALDQVDLNDLRPAGRTVPGIARTRGRGGGRRAAPFPLHMQLDHVAGLLEGVHRRGVRHIHHGHLVHRDDDVVDAQPAVGGSCSAGDQLGDVDGGVGADVGIVGASGDGEAQSGVASLQLDVLVQPAVVAIDLDRVDWD